MSDSTTTSTTAPSDLPGDTVLKSRVDTIAETAARIAHAESVMFIPMRDSESLVATGFLIKSAKELGISFEVQPVISQGTALDVFRTADADVGVGIGVDIPQTLPDAPAPTDVKDPVQELTDVEDDDSVEDGDNDDSEGVDATAFMDGGPSQGQNSADDELVLTSVCGPDHQHPVVSGYDIATQLLAYGSHTEPSPIACLAALASSPRVAAPISQLRIDNTRVGEIWEESPVELDTRMEGIALVSMLGQDIEHSVIFRGSFSGDKTEATDLQNSVKFPRSNMDSVDLNQFERAIEGRIADSELNAGCDGIPDGVRERFGSATWFQDSDYGKLATLDGLGEVFTLIGDVNAEKLILLTAGSFDAESALSFWEDHGGQIHGQLTDRDVIDVDGLPVHEIDGFIFAPISSARIARWYLESIQDVGVVASPRFVCVSAPEAVCEAVHSELSLPDVRVGWCGEMLFIQVAGAYSGPEERDVILESVSRAVRSSE